MHDSIRAFVQKVLAFFMIYSSLITSGFGICKLFPQIERKTKNGGIESSPRWFFVPQNLLTELKVQHLTPILYFVHYILSLLLWHTIWQLQFYNHTLAKYLAKMVTSKYDDQSYMAKLQ